MFWEVSLEEEEAADERSEQEPSELVYQQKQTFPFRAVAAAVAAKQSQMLLVSLPTEEEERVQNYYCITCPISQPVAALSVAAGRRQPN